MMHFKQKYNTSYVIFHNIKSEDMMLLYAFALLEFMIMTHREILFINCVGFRCVLTSEPGAP